MILSRGWKALVRAAPVWVIPLAALILMVSLTFLQVPAVEGA
jgi:hypothetical protein